MTPANKVLVITGTSKGIGLGIAKHFISKGYIVAGCGRSSSDVQLDNYDYSIVDVSIEEQVRGWIRSIRSKYGRIDVLICNAGLVQSALLMTMTSTNILDSFINTHVKGTYITCREVSKVMIQQKSGRIITVSSLAVPLHLEGTSAYTATKSAVVGMTKVLAKELAPMGITCNVLGPGLIRTGATKEFGGKWEESLLEKQTIKTLVSIEELCNVISFFIAPESRCITGQEINMCLVK
jgi:3-oxoacyl-[acyl-carrier protein] reductase